MNRGLVADPFQHRRGQLGIVAVEGGELAGVAAADRLRRAVDRRSSWAIAVTFEGPERRLSVADQFGSDRLHDLGGIVEPVVTVGSSMLIALQAGVG